jgi:hypothetical protein
MRLTWTIWTARPRTAWGRQGFGLRDARRRVLQRLRRRQNGWELLRERLKNVIKPVSPWSRWRLTGAHGFKTLPRAYCDGGAPDSPHGWLETLDKTPQAVGIMYRTWQNKYDLLAPFGDLLNRRREMGGTPIPVSLNR